MNYGGEIYVRVMWLSTLGRVELASWSRPANFSILVTDRAARRSWPVACNMKIEDKKLSLADAAGRRPAAAEVAFASGVRLKIAAVMLYEKSAVENMLDLRVRACALLQVDPAVLPALEDWAITPAVLVSALDRGVPARKADEAEGLLCQAEKVAEETRGEGRFFRITEIHGMDNPYPHLWRHVESVIEQRTARGLFGSRDVEEEIEQQWIHSGELFVTVKDEHGTRRDVRWSGVEQYRLVYAGESGQDDSD